MFNKRCYQLIDSNTKQYEEIRKLTIGQDEDYTTTGCFSIIDISKPIMK